MPDWCSFYCDVPPRTGGQTPIVLSSAIYEEMVEKDPDFVAKLEKVSKFFILWRARLSTIDSICNVY